MNLEDLIQRLRSYLKENPDKLTKEQKDILLYTMFNSTFALALFLEEDNNELFTNNELKTIQEFTRKIAAIKDPLARGVIDEIGGLLKESFIDSSQITPTVSQSVYEMTKQYFPRDSFKTILVVGDGIHSHMGRKLASDGYNVVCMDPLPVLNINLESEFDRSNGGSLKIMNVPFHYTHPIKDYVDAIVGSKIPDCAEQVVRAGKPCLFTLSLNPGANSIITIYGERMTNYPQMANSIKNAPGIKAVRLPGSNMDAFVRGGREHELPAAPTGGPGGDVR